MLISLVLEYFYLILRWSKVVDTKSLHIWLLEIANHHLLIVEIVLSFYIVCVTFRWTLLFWSLLLPTIVSIVNFAVSIRFSIFIVIIRWGLIIMALQVCLVRFHVCGDVVRLQMVLVLHYEHVVVCYHVICMVWNWVVKIVVEVVVARIILLRRLKNILNLCLEFLLLIELFLFVDLVHNLLVFDEFLALIFLSDCFVNDISFWFENADPAL